VRTDEKQRGLTLVEVLVAIAVLGSAVGAILVLMGGQARNAAALADNALARVVAENALVETVTSPGGLSFGTGTQEAGGRLFEWQASRGESPVPGTVLVEISVRREGQPQVLATLSTLTGEDE
jgi:general secretion pathway protein I